MVRYLIKTAEAGEKLIESKSEEKAQAKINMWSKFYTIVNITRVLAII